MTRSKKSTSAKTVQEKIAEINDEIGLLSQSANLYRGRSISVGPAGNGLLEIITRSDAATVWYQMQPTEAVEFLEQLAAACGLYVAIRPKNDFASWRNWKEDDLTDYAWRGANVDYNVGLKKLQQKEEPKFLPETTEEKVEENE